MAAVALRGVLRFLAGAEINRAGGFRLECHGRFARSFVGSVAEGLSVAQAAGTPVVSFPGFNSNGDRTGRWIAHKRGRRQEVGFIARQPFPYPILSRGATETPCFYAIKVKDYKTMGF